MALMSYLCFFFRRVDTFSCSMTFIGSELDSNKDSKKELFVHLALFKKKYCDVCQSLQDHSQTGWFTRKTYRNQKLLYSQLSFVTVREIQIKINKGKRLMGQSTEETKLSGNPSQRSCTECSEFSHRSCVTTNAKCCQPGKLPQTLMFRVFIRGQSQRHATLM